MSALADRPLVADLPFEPEELIVVEIRHGVARTELVHLPARRVVEQGRGGPMFDRYDFPPSAWPSACRRIPDGAIYVRAGMLAEAPICPDCEEELA